MNKCLLDTKCKACEGNVEKLDAESINTFLKLIENWEVLEERLLQRKYKFKNFGEALKFVNKLGELAEKEKHHPDIYLYNWNRVRVSLTTHSIKGLTTNDFIMAQKINTIEI
jgi:4a-hydroxytetrahydrobiopterin dehydratase